MTKSAVKQAKPDGAKPPAKTARPKSARPRKAKTPETPGERAKRLRALADAAEVEAADERDRTYKANEKDRFVVTVLTAERVPQDVIAKSLNAPWGIKRETMTRHYEVELSTASGKLLSLAYGRIMRDIGSGTANPGNKEGAASARWLAERASSIVSERMGSPQGQAALASAGGSREITFTFKIGEGSPHERDPADSPVIGSATADE